MELSIPIVALILFFPSLLLVGIKLRKPAHRNLPPGKSGWPFFGESLEFLRANREGRAYKFVRDRVERYNSTVFRTFLMGEPMVFLCGPAGNKFLFSNEGKKVALWWPSPVRRLTGPSLLTSAGDEARVRKKLLMAGFFNTESLKKSVPVMDEITRNYLKANWQGKEEVQVHPSIKLYAFELTCRLLMSITEPDLISRLLCEFNVFIKGLMALPLNIPGTPFYRAARAADVIRRELHALLRQRRVELQRKVASPKQDIISYLLMNADENGKFMPEPEIINDMLTLLFAAYDTSSCTISLLVKYLAEQPRVHAKVLKEQREIAAPKAPGELLNWDDLQKMKYSWNVVSEVMRIAPPVTGSFQEALVNFTFAGYTIPKGWKLYWSAAYTHKDPSCYPNAMEFDESRFEGAGPPPFSYAPFGGGPRMCLGKEFARLDILVFLHNLVHQFDWDLIAHNEKLSYDPLLRPVNGLPVRLRSRESSN
ncbi:hypothetical protein CDL15_Pgr024597 [Punica granatum]|uniref:Beta-amyrin 28-monooxygenase-like n=1 Tax=Punica granatum TaxID=22663 RepID=A0A218XYI0_PUNGR|nr:hypothetical protein CDL15_Pgr024597 [Punica granatum]